MNKTALEIRRYSTALALLDNPEYFRVLTWQGFKITKDMDYKEIQDAFFAYDCACLDGKYAKIEGVMSDGKVRVYEQNYLIEGGMIGYKDYCKQ